MVDFFATLSPTVIGIEACGASHHWARLLRSFGHEVKLIAPQLVKPYVKRGKNDAADAEALCEAMSRPTMRFVPVKTAEQQAALMLVERARSADPQSHPAIKRHPRLCGRVRAYRRQRAALSSSRCSIRIQADEERAGPGARAVRRSSRRNMLQLQEQIAEIEAKLMAWQRADECSRRLAKIPGIGPIGAALLRMKTPAPELFRIGPTVRGLDGPDAEGSFDRRQESGSASSRGPAMKLCAAC